MIQADATSAVAYSSAFNEPVYHVIFDLAEEVVFTEGIYWLEPKITTPEPSTVWWAVTASGSDGAAPMISEDGGETWISMEGYEPIFFVAGDCGLLSVSDVTSVDLEFYPNPVNDILNIQSNVAVQSVEVYNLLGQRVLISKSISNGELNMSNLTSGIYLVRATFEGGQVETFKVVKK